MGLLIFEIKPVKPVSLEQAEGVKVHGHVTLTYLPPESDTILVVTAMANRITSLENKKPPLHFKGRVADADPQHLSEDGTYSILYLHVQDQMYSDMHGLLSLASSSASKDKRWKKPLSFHVSIWSRATNAIDPAQEISELLPSTQVLALEDLK